MAQHIRGPLSYERMNNGKEVLEDVKPYIEGRLEITSMYKRLAQQEPK